MILLKTRLKVWFETREIPILLHRNQLQIVTMYMFRKIDLQQVSLVN